MTKGTRRDNPVIAEDRPIRSPTPQLSDAPDTPRPRVTPGERWAQLVVAAVTSAEPIASLADWALIVRLSTRTLRNRCRAAGLRAKASLDFTRLLRIVVQYSRGSEMRFADALEDYDPRTIARLMHGSGLAESSGVPDLATFLQHQTFVVHTSALDAVSSNLARL